MNKYRSRTDWPVLLISGGLLVAFVLASFINVDFVSNMVNQSFAFAVKYFGGFWQVLFLGTFFIALFLGFSKYGNIRLGGLEKPEVAYFKWIAMIMTTLLAGGGVFWAAAEPMYHFLDPSPNFAGASVVAATESAVIPAFAQSYLHWGFLAWSILGTLGTIVLMYAHYQKGMPLKPRTLLYPLLGEKIMKNSALGTIIDASAVIAVAAGTIGPIGFLGLQAAYGMEVLFGIPNNLLTQVIIIIGVVIIATISAISGLRKGIQFLSNLNIIITLILMAAILILGPGGFILNTFLAATGVHLQEFLAMSTFRGDSVWLGSWTIFFWGWFLGYGPMMAIFISTITRGRTIRELILAVSITAPIVTAFWFTVVGGTGMFYELAEPGIISDALNTSGMPAAMMAITQQLPLDSFIAPLFLLVTILFVVTTADSMAYTISVAITGDGHPPKSMRIFWAVIMGAVAIVLLMISEGGIEAIQSFIVVTAIPVSLLLVTTFWSAPKAAKVMYEDQFGRTAKLKNRAVVSKKTKDNSLKD
ncbi:BCCT family transporter [Planococcus sp. ANT_H30]|uniref:BCCT transporter n=1 Tax=Planococcus kocurii TaxID=1374 RepID=A0ABM5WZB2_9BACL|nr:MULTISPECIES: BCCT family transporter [Planococcus]ALS79696.1 BCCT transporter [Planococcus kocurii]KAA0955332.1 BCCT family transporter [Planococcus sp. ANT_H30]